MSRLASATLWLVAAAAAAAVFAPLPVLVLGFAESTTTRAIAAVVLVACAAILWLLVRIRREPTRAVLGPFAGGALAVWALAVAAIFAAYAFGSESDSCGSEPADTIAWSGFVVLYLGIGAWSLRTGRRAFWALPLAFTLAAAWLIGLAAAFPGPSGCGD